MPQKFFITHSWKDIEFARKLCNDLTANGLDGFFDERSVRPGESIPKRIEQGIEQCDVYIPVLSPDALKSRWADWEIDMAIMMNREQGRPQIIPVIAEKCDVPRRLRHILYVNFVGRYDDALKDLLIKGFGITPKPPRPVAPPLPPKNPERMQTLPRWLVPAGIVVAIIVVVCALASFVAGSILNGQTPVPPISVTAGVQTTAVPTIVPSSTPTLTPLPTDTVRPAVTLPKSTDTPTRPVETFTPNSTDTPHSTGTLTPKPKDTLPPTLTLTPKLPTVTPSSTDTVRPIATFTPKPPNPPTATLGIGSTRIFTDGATMMFVPDGDFTTRNSTNIHLDSFWIDKYEVTNALYKKCVDAYQCSQPNPTIAYYVENRANSWYSSYNYYFSYPTWGNYYPYSDYPVIYVSWFDANDFCTWANKRLPTEAEWEKAASWDETKRERRDYPYGNNFDINKLNVPPSWRDNGYGRTTAVGSFSPGGDSPYGVADMVGNVWEWVANWLPGSAGEKILRGGSWNSDPSDSNTFYAKHNLQIFRDKDVGFRCASSSVQ